jgi:regulator of cell morphogenesis and NO signaling
MNKHIQITGSMKMADMIHLNYLLLPIIGRFGIELGFGNKTVNEICSEKEINTSFFLEILNNYHNPDYFTAHDFERYPLVLIIDYLKNTHNYYASVKIPELGKMVAEIIDYSNEDNKTNNKLIANFFEEYKQELLKHLQHEEQHLFPYTYELEEAIKTGIVNERLHTKIKSNNTHHEEDEHSQLEEKLFDLKNLIIKFLPPVKRKETMEKLLIELFRLENDLNDHSRIEDRVLLPKVIQLEQLILKKSDQQ